jgi:uncharacterized integral membrane protein
MTTQHKIKGALLVILIALLITVIFQNTEITTVKLFFWEIEASRIFVFAGFATAGFLVGAGTIWWLTQRWKKQHN